MQNLLESLVLIPGATTGSGIIKYIGPIHGKVGTFVGLELDILLASSRGRNNGDVEGIQYFEVTVPGSGLFLPWDRLRSANGHLPAITSNKASGQDHIRTPSPTARGIKSRVSSSISSDNRFNVGRDSPLRVAPKLLVANRRVSSKDLYRPVSQGTRAVSSGHIYISSADDSTDRVIDTLKRELSDARMLLETKDHALMEKTAVLEDLQLTISELSPILQNCEANIAEKDRKMQKQKQDYEAARGEWRQSLDLMLNAQQETELLYELEISELRQELAVLGSKRGATNWTKNEFDCELRMLKRENELFNSQLKVLESGDPELSHRSHRFEVFEYDQKLSKQESASTPGALNFSGAEVDANKAFVTEFREKEECESRNEELLEQFESLSVWERKANEAEIVAQVKLLEEKLVAQKVAAKISLADLKGFYEERVAQEAKESADREKEILDREAVQKHRIVELENELKSLKTRVPINSPSVDSPKCTAMSLELEEAHNQIEELKHQLNMRPTLEELTELQNAMDEVDSLHRLLLLFKDNKITELQSEVTTLTNELRELKTVEHNEKSTPVEHRDFEVSTASPLLKLNGDSAMGSLGIYVPAKATDASAGRDNWCGLCEKEGHSSLQCPYENDMF